MVKNGKEKQETKKLEPIDRSVCSMPVAQESEKAFGRRISDAIDFGPVGAVAECNEVRGSAVEFGSCIG